MRLSPRFKLSCSFAQRATVCPLIIAPAFKRRTIALCPKHLTWPRHFFSPRLRKYARSPALCAPAGKHFSWPSLLCHAVKSLPAPVCLRSSPFLPLGFSLSRLFSQSALAKFIGFLSAKFLPLFIGAPQSRFVCPGRFSCAASFQANLCPLVFPFPSSG